MTMKNIAISRTIGDKAPTPSSRFQGTIASRRPDVRGSERRVARSVGLRWLGGDSRVSKCVGDVVAAAQSGEPSPTLPLYSTECASPELGGLTPIRATLPKRRLQLSLGRLVRV